MCGPKPAVGASLKSAKACGTWLTRVISVSDQAAWRVWISQRALDLFAERCSPPRSRGPTRLPGSFTPPSRPARRQPALPRRPATGTGGRACRQSWQAYCGPCGPARFLSETEATTLLPVGAPTRIEVVRAVQATVLEGRWKRARASLAAIRRFGKGGKQPTRADVPSAAFCVVPSRLAIALQHCRPASGTADHERVGVEVLGGRASACYREDLKCGHLLWSPMI